MTPDKKHAQYEEFRAVWQTCRDAATGQRAVHAGGKKYLPELGGQTSAEYEAYKGRALYFNATGRTVDGMCGLVFRKQPTIELPTALEPYSDDINMGGLSLEGFAKETVEEALKVGRIGILVDYPPPPDGAVVLTVEQAKSLGQRPYIAHYKAENILNWKIGRVANATTLVSVWLLETYEENDEEKEQIRQLFLDGVYGQRIWRKSQQSDKAEWVQFGPDYFPKKGGKGFGRIPFYIAAPKEGGPDVQEPPIEDLAYVNLAHYRNSADLENGAHVAGLPTPWINGITNPDEFPEMHLGSNTCLKLPPDAEAGFLQCGAEGFATIEKAMDRKQDQMAALGARMLSSEKAAAETAEAHTIKRGGENSVLAALAGSVEKTITQALRFMADWVGANHDDVVFELNKDFLPSPMDAQMLTALVAAWQSGAVSDETFFGTLVAGELVPETLTYDDEQDRKANSVPALGLTNDNQ